MNKEESTHADEKPAPKPPVEKIEPDDNKYCWIDVLIAEEYHIRDIEKSIKPKKREAESERSRQEEPTDFPPEQLDSRVSGPERVQEIQERWDWFRGSRNKIQRDAFCMSGGGIRSACINLGVLQGLAKKGHLSKFHYLSTVSGGGYIGSWLSTWINALGGNEKTDARKIEERLQNPSDGVEPQEVTNLRTNSNYLTPQVGAFSVDLFACLMIVARNMIVNWLVLIPAFAACLAFVMFVLMAGSLAMDGLNSFDWCFGIAAVSCLLVNGLFATRLMPVFLRARKCDAKFGAMSPVYERLMNFRWAMTLTASFALAIWTHFVSLPAGNPWLLSFFGYFPIYAVIFVPYLVGLRRAYVKSQDAAVTRGEGSYWPQVALGVLASALVSYAIARAAFAFLRPGPESILQFFLPLLPYHHHTLYLAIAPAVWVLVLELQNFLTIGCLSMVTSDEDREWWARSNGVALLLALGWTALCCIAAYGPALYTLLILHRSELWALVASQFTLGGILALMSSSAKTPATQRDRPAPVRMWLLQGGAVLFFVGLAMLLAAGNYSIAAGMHNRIALVTKDEQLKTGPIVYPDSSKPLTRDFQLQKTDKTISVQAVLSLPAKNETTDATEIAGVGGWICLAALWASITAAASWLININQFSIQCLYRNRLLRCFIGAVRRADNQAQVGKHEYEPFTGFDTTDNYDVTKLRNQLPFHVINIAQNLIKPTNLAWQQRMACSFTVSPLHTGGKETGYRNTNDFGGGISIGTAVSTSGAAVNPSMGHATAPLLEFLMTLFNVRLGWWVGNPGSNKLWKEVGPRFALKPLISEMFGQTDEGQKYVLLSDGGHFEDLGIYEMIQRRCRFLLVVDGGADPTGNFEDLGNAVRKVRIDLGVEIDFLFNRTSPKLAKTKDHRQHFAVAKIKYSEADRAEGGKIADGWLLYIKGCLNGDESEDIYQYKQFYKDFPHQTTLDQWFDESQFESYRALGEHSILMTLDALQRKAGHGVPGVLTDEEILQRKAEYDEFTAFLRGRGFLP